MYRSHYPGLAEWLEETVECTLSVFTLPEKHRQRMRTSNGLERFMEEIKRRSKVIRIFPNRASCLRLVSALAMEQSEEWLAGKMYLDMTLTNTQRQETEETEALAYALAGTK